jgi:hypothetical protein
MADGTFHIEIGAESRDGLDALFRELRGRNGIRAEAVIAPGAGDEQGTALDILTVALSGGAVTAFLEIIRTLLEARGPRFMLKIRRGRDRLEITSDTVEEALPALRALLGEGLPAPEAGAAQREPRP